MQKIKWLRLRLVLVIIALFIAVNFISIDRAPAFALKATSGSVSNAPIVFSGNSGELSAYSADVHQLTFDSQGGGEIEPQWIAYGAYINHLPTPARIGYIFKGWWTSLGSDKELFKENTLYDYNSDIELYADWETVSYLISYNNVNGAANGNQTTYTIKSADITLANLGVYGGYTFGGWYTSEQLTGAAVTGIAIEAGSTGAKTFYAKWTANVYTLTFDSLGGTEVWQQVAKYGERIGELAAPVRDGYTFGGWWTDANGGEQYTEYTKYAVADDVQLYARWTKDFSLFAGLKNDWVIILLFLFDALSLTTLAILRKRKKVKRV
jgi:uncharacterized repeat protein (TIGR02543 family)